MTKQEATSPLPMRRLFLCLAPWSVLPLLACHSATACTPQEAWEKRAVAWDKAVLASMVDLDAGRSLERRVLELDVAGLTRTPNADWDKLCVTYDEIVKIARCRITASAC